ncbi:vascular endothelial growth factor receptor 1 isoform X2 [Venturia canescens]|uniref:vascular endothelial growth factor receptor 1 isoform X2 n=1 Tax=Venturia canescens TaxID=32260 RepID=UPI001C9C53E3|nr:vascular endothelial growth factor receptor 1 isoform X2 [Venturia canescens]
MFRTFKKSFGFFIVVLLCQDCRAHKPQLSPDEPEIYISEGEALELACTSSKNIQFYYPEDIGYSLSTSVADLSKQDLGNTQRINFSRKDTVHGDTGWYGCADQDVEVTPGVYDQPDVSWTYVWVMSNSSYFVQTNILESIRAAVGESVVIPCRPTSPAYNVTLYANHETKVKLGPDVSYDPKFGFRIRNITWKKIGYYTCKIEDGTGETQELNYYVNVIKHQTLKHPKIDDKPLKHVTRGQTLYVNCSITLELDLNHVLNWTTPQKDARISQRKIDIPFGKTLQIVVAELVIDGVTDADEGEYECTVTTYYDIKKTQTYIKVHDPNVKYIRLKSLDDDSYYQKKDGDRIQWMVQVDAYPQPLLKWLSPRGHDIVGSWLSPERSKYAINISSTMAILRINRLDLNDMGVYSLQATNAEQIETLNFTLDVSAIPIPMLDKANTFYMPKQKAVFRCEVAAHPTPNVTWSYLKAPNYPSLNESEIISLKGGQIIPKTTTFLSVVSTHIDVSGLLTCTACNIIGCDEDTAVILVTDVPGGFGIVERGLHTIGDNVVLTCAASIYNYTNVEWLTEDHRRVVETDRISLTNRTTNFTHRVSLEINNITKFDNNSQYICSAINIDSEDTDTYVYTLEMQDPLAPYIYETNMNRTEVTYDLSTEGHKTVVLKCYVRGMPVPNITWHKDDTTIKPGEQYMFLHKHQELHIKYLLDEDSGKYSCKASNRFGKDENYQSILIKAKAVPKSLIISIVVLVVICVILVIYFTTKIHREKVIRKQLMEAGLTHFEEGALECLNPDLTVDDQAELLPYDKKWEFPREKLKFGKQLGFGAFGVVMKADAHGICEDEDVTTVAVKMVRRSTESTYIRALASELKIMVHLGKHLNVVNLLGACTKNIAKRELLVIVEYCRFGNLHNYLLRHRGDFINQIDPNSGKFDPTIGLDLLVRTTSVGSNNSGSAVSYNSNPSAELVGYTSGGTDTQSVSLSPDGCVLSNNSTQPGWRSNYHGDYKDQNLKPICTQDLLSWAFQVARGMEYLSQRKVLHGDLAARNILLAENNIVKICDFGLAKTMYKDDNYKKKGDAPLPIKWMAIESIRDRVFSTQSDIWSFGIVLWEFFTLAKTPYPGMEAEKQYQRLIEGYRMEKPEYATDELYDIMLRCWKAKPTLRPTFTSLVTNIGDLLEESVKEHYIDLNAPYMDMNTMILESGKDDYLTMMSAPDHNILTSHNRDYVNSTCTSPGARSEDSYLPMSPSCKDDQSVIFGSKRNSEENKFTYPDKKAGENANTDSESEAVEDSPMLNEEDDEHYLKPINVHERRAEFARRNAEIKSATMKKSDENISGYCNTPLNLGELNDRSVDPSKTNDTNNKDSNSYVPTIIRTVDNYVNMPRQKNDLRKDGASSFSNPSYVSIDNNR